MARVSARAPVTETFMFTFDFTRLAAIGLTPALLQSLLQQAQYDATLCRVSEVQRDVITVHDGEHEHVCRLGSGLWQALQTDDGIAVGDWALARCDSHGGWWLLQRFAPAAALSRRDSHGQRQRIASHIDTALLVMGLDGDFNLRRLERYLSMVQAAGISPVVVLSKADQCADPDAAIQAVRQRIPHCQHVLALNGTDAASCGQLAPWLGAGQTLVLLGSSGAGKSTLGNTLLGDARQQTGAVREGDSRGRHTTTARSLHCLPGGGCLIDTPGVRTLQPDLDAGQLADSFADIQALAAHCQFRDCRHQQEPGCAVRDAVDADRLHNYFKLLREAQRGEESLLQRKAQQAEWKRRSKAMRQKQKLE